METDNSANLIVNAHLRLLALNFGSWKPEVEAWLHSEEAEAPLQELLIHVPCSPTIH
jgi:hypothetical protein